MGWQVTLFERIHLEVLDQRKSTSQPSFPRERESNFGCSLEV